MRTTAVILLGLMSVAGVEAQAPRTLERNPPKGIRRPMKDGELFVPAGCRPARGRVDVVVHLHGAAWVVQQALAEAKWDAVLVTMTLKGLSSVYDRAFSDAKRFKTLMKEARTILRGCRGFDGVDWNRIVLSSFSAGYGGVRRILAQPDHAASIDAVVLADSLHSGYEGKKPRPSQMKPFRDWARRAARGKKLLWTTHSAVATTGYASTTETNDDLVRSVGATRKATKKTNAWGMVLETSVDVRGFHLRGYAGATAEDHMRHLWFLGEPLAAVRKRLR